MRRAQQGTKSHEGKRGLAALIANAQLPLPKVAALWFDKLVLPDPVGAEWVLDWRDGKKTVPRKWPAVFIWCIDE